MGTAAMTGRAASPQRLMKCMRREEEGLFAKGVPAFEPWTFLLG